MISDVLISNNTIPLSLLLEWCLVNNPCRHGGVCGNTDDGGFSCDCAGTGFTGQLCQTEQTHEVVVVEGSCTDRRTGRECDNWRRRGSCEQVPVVRETECRRTCGTCS